MSQRLLLLATEATESMLTCKWGHGQMKRARINQGARTPPHIGFSFRARVEKKGKKPNNKIKHAKHLRNKKVLLPPTSLRKKAL